MSDLQPEEGRVSEAPERLERIAGMIDYAVETRALDPYADEDAAFLRDLAAALPALREQVEAEVRERLAREFERRAATAVDGVAAGFQTNAAQLVRTFGTTEEER